MSPCVAPFQVKTNPDKRYREPFALLQALGAGRGPGGKRHRTACPAADMWSLGCIIFELYCR